MTTLTHIDVVAHRKWPTSTWRPKARTKRISHSVTKPVTITGGQFNLASNDASFSMIDVFSHPWLGGLFQDATAAVI